jgi:hypothetical protein
MNLPLAQSIINELPSKVQTLLSMKGQFLTITYGKECKVRKGEAPIFKFSKMMLRAGVSYDEIQAVKAKRESGELPAENQGLAWGAYVPGLYPYIIEHKGNLYFRFFTVPNAQRYAPTFVRNGKEITREEAQTACLASEFQERETTLETLTVKVEGILEINGKEVV